MVKYVAIGNLTHQRFGVTSHEFAIRGKYSSHKQDNAAVVPTSYLMPLSLSQVSTLRQKGEMLGTVGVLENCNGGNDILSALQMDLR